MFNYSGIYRYSFVPSGELNHPISDHYSYTLSRAVYFYLKSNPPVRGGYSHQYTVINRHLLWNRKELNLGLRIFSPTNIQPTILQFHLWIRGLEPSIFCLTDSSYIPLKFHLNILLFNKFIPLNIRTI